MTVNASSNNFQEEHLYRLTGETKEPLVIKITAKPPIKKTIVPVIFIPGIFGSRLENPGGEDKDSCFIWDPNRTISLMDSYAKSVTSIFMQRYWSDKEINDKVTRLHNTAAVVMKDHRYDGKKNKNESIIRHIQNSPTFSRLTKQYDFKTLKGNEWIDRSEGGSVFTELANQVAKEEYERRCQRGWYGVLDDYDPLLEALHELRDSEFIYPVYAFGYDWRYDLDQAAEKLVTKINEVRAIQDYPDFGEQGKEYEKIHPKALIVTHSQGSMVARYALKKLGAEGKVQAVIHLNQPTTGAPVLYRRFVTGTGSERMPFSFGSILDNISDRVFGAILGNNPYHFTCMAAPLTGALALLPTNDYIVQAGQADEHVAADVGKHQWLRHEDPRLQADEPVTDVYDNIYLSEKHGLINCKRYDAAGNPNPYQESEFDIVQSTFEAGGETKTWQQPRHTLAPGEIEKLSGVTILPPPADNPYRRDNQRLRPHAGLGDKAYQLAEDYWEEFTKNIKKAQTFHETLGLAQHDNTHVIRARGVATVTYVKFKLDAANLLKCELERTFEGDGTVPLSSQEALIHQCAEKPAKTAGPIIQNGKHADICTHAEAMKSVKALLTGELVVKLRTQTQVKQA